MREKRQQRCMGGSVRVQRRLCFALLARLVLGRRLDLAFGKNVVEEQKRKCDSVQHADGG